MASKGSVVGVGVEVLVGVVVTTQYHGVVVGVGVDVCVSVGVLVLVGVMVGVAVGVFVGVGVLLAVGLAVMSAIRILFAESSNLVPRPSQTHASVTRASNNPTRRTTSLLFIFPSQGKLAMLLLGSILLLGQIEINQASLSTKAMENG